jgi:lipopolysaccharide transport system permease protein
LKVPTGDVPYPVFTYTALIPWTLFSTAMTQAGASLVVNANLISKVYFPRLIVPLSSVLGALVDFAIAFVVLLVMMLVYRLTPGIAVLTLPLFLGLAILTALGIGLWLAAIEVRYRDVGHSIPFLAQLWLFATPVAYPLSLIPERWRFLYGLNPMVGVVEGFRWALLGTATRPPLGQIALSAAFALVLFVTGVLYFQRTEQVFADVV